ncbi:MAG: hypothetical protein ABJB11_22215 [Ferruginibacter sp.]
MNNQTRLNHFSYSIPASTLAVAEIKGNGTVAEHLPIVKVLINFVDGKLNLEGDWRYMVAVNKHNENRGINYHRERVKIEMDIEPIETVDLNEQTSDGLLFLLKGTVLDNNYNSTCTGFLVIENVRNSKQISNHWDISFYIYDTQFYDCEITFKLPLYTIKTDCTLN